MAVLKKTVAASAAGDRGNRAHGSNLTTKPTNASKATTEELFDADANTISTASTSPLSTTNNAGVGCIVGGGEGGDTSTKGSLTCSSSSSSSTSSSSCSSTSSSPPSSPINTPDVVEYQQQLAPVAVVRHSNGTGDSGTSSSPCGELSITASSSFISDDGGSSQNHNCCDVETTTSKNEKQQQEQQKENHSKHNEDDDDDDDEEDEEKKLKEKKRSALVARMRQEMGGIRTVGVLGIVETYYDSDLQLFFNYSQQKTRQLQQLQQEQTKEGDHDGQGHQQTQQQQQQQLKPKSHITPNVVVGIDGLNERLCTHFTSTGLWDVNKVVAELGGGNGGNDDYDDYDDDDTSKHNNHQRTLEWI